MVARLCAVRRGGTLSAHQHSSLFAGRPRENPPRSAATHACLTSVRRCAMLAVHNIANCRTSRLRSRTHLSSIVSSVISALLVLVAALVCIVSTSEAECINYGKYLHWVGGVGTPGGARGIAVVGSYAYVT